MFQCFFWRSEQANIQANSQDPSGKTAFSKLAFQTFCRYCAGTMPWGNPGDHRDFEPQRHDDGYIEVIGFTMASLVSIWQVLPLLKVGGDSVNSMGSITEEKLF